MPPSDSTKPVTKWNLYNLVIYTWAVKCVLWFLDAIMRLGNRFNFKVNMPEDIKKEIVAPLLMVIALIIGLWVANDCSFTLPHYLP